MLAQRLIPCLDVKDNQVVKGIQFQAHRVVGDILALAEYYSLQGADELVFYDITASSDKRTVAKTWVSQVARIIDIPFCVAGGITCLQEAEALLNAGADKISINSPALACPELINALVHAFGSQCVVIGIDSLQMGNENWVCQYTGDAKKTQVTAWRTEDWVKEVQSRGAGEIVLNCMNHDGVRQGYAIEFLKALRPTVQVPFIASGGAGNKQHFLQVFQEGQVDGALAASVFHSGEISIPDLKNYLCAKGIRVRPWV